MVGDTPDADREGPREFGMHGYHLDRRGAAAPDNGSLRSLADVLRLVDDI